CAGRMLPGRMRGLMSTAFLLAILLALPSSTPAAAAVILPGGGAAERSPPDPDSLAPTAAVPWNPDRPIPRRALWEQALLLPGRIATLPLTAVDAAANRALLAAEHRGLMQRITAARGAQASPFGIRVGGPNLGDRTGL